MRLLLLLIVGAAVVAAEANAQEILRSDPKRPVETISRDLGLTSAQFVACFYGVDPAPQGTRASGERERANKAMLLPCLQRANPSITNESLDAVMDKYRPEGRVAG